MAGVLMWVTNVASSAAVASALIDYSSRAYAPLAEPMVRSSALLAVYSLLIALNARGIKVGARAIVIMASAKLLPLIALAIAGLFLLHENIDVEWTALPGWQPLGTSMVLVIFAYAGLETALIPTAEVKDPSRLVPRATLTAIAFIVALYLSLQVVSQSALGASLASSSAPLADAAGKLWAPGFALLLATAAVSMLGFLQGNLLASSRLVFALARDGFLPHQLARVTATHRVPVWSVVVHGGVGCALALGGSFSQMALVSGGANCLVYVACCAAAWRLQQRGIAEHREPLVLPAGGLIPIISCLAMAAILATLTRAEWIAITIATAAAMVLYAIARFARRATQSESEQPLPPG
jgi:amino acid transporter